MSAHVTIISEDYSNRGQSWTLNGVYRVGNGSAILHVEIRDNAYQEQSYAKIESWGAEGWRFFTSLPVEEWYDLLPSYTKKGLDKLDREQFLFLANELLSRYVAAMWGTNDGITRTWAVRRSDYLEAQDDGVVPVAGELARA